MQYQWVRSSKDLAELISSWTDLSYAALDTEFERTNTYFARPGLIQLADGEQVYLIDPLEVRELVQLKELLANTNTTIVMHSMSEDIDLLRNITGVAPKKVFDTQIAASFLGLGSSLGYQNLVQEVLDVELDKSETRSDWLKRPLTESQISYAAKDAEYLCQLYEALKTRLEQAGLYEACMEETRNMVDQIMESWDYPEQAYLKLRGGWDLRPEQQWLLKALLQWRDRTACEKNKPKPWIFNDAVLLQIAQKRPGKAKDLNRIKNISHKSVHRYGEQVIEVLEEAEQTLAEQPELLQDFNLIPAPVRGTEVDTYRRLKRIVEGVSEQTGISPQLLGSRKMLEQLVVATQRKKTGKWPVAFQGWRAQYLAQPFKELLKEKGVSVD